MPREEEENKCKKLKEVNQYMQNGVNQYMENGVNQYMENGVNQYMENGVNQYMANGVNQYMEREVSRSMDKRENHYKAIALENFDTERDQMIDEFEEFLIVD